MDIATDALTADGRALTAELLQLRGQPITLTTVGTPTVKPGGGKDYTGGVQRQPQTFSLFNSKGFDGRENSQTDQGMSRKFAYNLVGAWNAQIAVGDTWEDDAAKYVVETVDRGKPYLIQATVTGYLKEPGHGFG